MKIADIIKYEGDNSTFIWKHPCEDFNSLTQLVVHESQEAIFFMNGQALDLFGPGRHTLETQNIPEIGKVLKRITDGETPFHCEVYFINKTVQMAIKWGTDSKVRFIEPNYGIPLEIGACGELNLMVSNARKLLLKLVGTMNGIAWEERGQGFTKSIQNSFRPLISTAVKTHLPTTIKYENVDLFEIDQHIEKLSAVLHKNILPGFEEYGLTIPQFYVTNIVLPESDPNFRRMKDLHTLSFQAKMVQAETFMKTTQAEADVEVTVARRKVEMERQTTETEIAKREADRELIKAQTEAQAAKISGMADIELARMAGLTEAEVMAAKGYNQKDVLQSDVQKAYAEGIGNMTITGGAAGDIVGLGVGFAAAGAMAPKIGEMFNGMENAGEKAVGQISTPSSKCTKCGASLPENAKFCLECGEKVVVPTLAGMVVCPECGNTVAKGKFCPECGHKFKSNCPKCGADLVSGAKFCLECGEKL